jgi:uncharacterized protein YutE (UPF0331/DUF86 family)
MNPITKRQKQSLIKRLTFAEIELKDSRKFKKTNYDIYREDRDIRRNLERLIENIVNATLDMAKIIIAGEDLELPDTYKEAFDRLSESGLITKDLATSLGKFTHLRNILAHQYLDIRWKMIEEFLSDAEELFENFYRIYQR